MCICLNNREDTIQQLERYLKIMSGTRIFRSRAGNGCHQLIRAAFLLSLILYVAIELLLFLIGV